MKKPGDGLSFSAPRCPAIRICRFGAGLYGRFQELPIDR
jgi:hypothetical protein